MRFLAVLTAFSCIASCRDGPNAPPACAGRVEAAPRGCENGGAFPVFSLELPSLEQTALATIPAFDLSAFAVGQLRAKQPGVVQWWP